MPTTRTPAKRLMQLEDLFRMKAVGRTAIAPDGNRVAFELKRFDLAENKNFVQLMLADIGDVGAARPAGRDGRNGHAAISASAAAPPGAAPTPVAIRALTDGPHSDTLPRWSPDGTRLAFLSNREKVTCLYILPMAGGEPHRLTDRDGHVQDFRWSPDGRRLAFTYQPLNERERLERDEKKDELRKRPHFKHITRLKHKLDGAGWWNGEYTHVWLVGVDGGKARQLTSGKFDDREPRFSPDGRLVSFVSNRVANADMNTENADIFVVGLRGGAPRKITRMQGGCQAHAWSPDGKTIAYVGDAARPGEGWKHVPKLWLVAARGGKPRELTRDVDNPHVNETLGDVAFASFDAPPPAWSADGTRLYFVVSEHGATRLYSRSVLRKDTRLELGGDINIIHFDRAPGDGPFALSVGTAVAPGDVYALYLGERPHEHGLRRLSSVNTALLARVEVSEPEEVRVRSGPNALQAWILRPPRFDPRRKYPAILEIHGGPAAQYGSAFFHEMQWLAAKGYVVMFANPRGSAGYGLDFQKCIHADWGNLDYKDLMRVADHLFALPYVDRRRIGVTGGSYGGYMTNWIVGHTDRFRAAVTQRSVVNLESMFGTSDFGFELGQEFGGRPWEKLELFRRQSPLTFVKNVRTPLLIEHEEEDHRCPIEQAEQLFASLKVLGRTVELVRFEGDSHGLSRTGSPQNRAERLRRIAGWFDKHLR